MTETTVAKKEPRIEKVERGIEVGTRMKIRGGKYYGLELKDLPASAVRQEEVRYNSESGREEPMVTVTVPFSDGRQSLPLDMPRRHLRTSDDPGPIGFFFGKITRAAANAVPLPFQNPFRKDRKAS